MTEHIIHMPPEFPVTCHTDFVGKNTTFIAVEGYSENGIYYINKALEKGASTIMIDKNTILPDDIALNIIKHNAQLVLVDDTRKALAEESAKQADFPAKKIKIIGITGTKGKTTTSFLLEHIFRAAGYNVGLISSAGNHINGVRFPACLTTPQPDYLQQFLKMCVEHDVTHVIMEVAAQALTLHRVRGIEFDGVIFTNFSHEHLEFYHNLDDYYQAKCAIFDMAKPSAPIIINQDDSRADTLRKQLLHKNVYEVSVNSVIKSACYHAEYHNNDTSITVQSAKSSERVKYSDGVLLGLYNSYNIVMACAMSHLFSLSFTQIEKALFSFQGVPGRLQAITLPNKSRAYIDYAHNPSSFTAVLSTLRVLTKHLIVIFGAGGGRDTLKRPIMGSIAAHYADLVVLTSDNPRLENVDTIIEDIRNGITQEHTAKITVMHDREKAIEYAYKHSQSDSIIALLGKGPDEFQIIGKEKYFFSEKTILQRLS